MIGNDCEHLCVELTENEVHRSVRNAIEQEHAHRILVNSNFASKFMSEEIFSGAEQKADHKNSKMSLADNAVVDSGHCAARRMMQNSKMPDYLSSYVNAARHASDSTIQLPAFSGLRRLALIASAIACLLLASAFLVPIDVVLTTRAVAVPASGIQRFRAPITGQVTFPVSEGSTVKAGSIVAVIDSNLVSSRLDGAADAASQLAEDKVRVGDASLKAVTDALDAKRELARARNESVRATISSIRNEMAIRSKQLESARVLMTRAQTLGKERLISELQLAGYEDRKLDLESSIEALNRQLGDAEHELLSTDTEMQALTLEMAEFSLANERSSLDIQESLEGALAERRVTLVAPNRSRVASLQSTSGSIVNEGDDLLTLVPDGGGVILEANVPHSDIATLEVGQAAVLTFDALPRRDYGDGLGVVQSIAFAASPTSESTVLTPQGAYFVRILMDDRSPETLRRAIRPGMVASVRIKTGKRPIASNLFAKART